MAPGNAAAGVTFLSDCPTLIGPSPVTVTHIRAAATASALTPSQAPILYLKTNSGGCKHRGRTVADADSEPELNAAAGPARPGPRLRVMNMTLADSDHCQITESDKRTVPSLIDSSTAQANRPHSPRQRNPFGVRLGGPGPISR